MLNRPDVFKSDRIKVTEKMLLSEVLGRRVLELGAGDYSFDYIAGSVFWVRADLSSPCDIACDFNSAALSLPVKSESLDLIICTEVLEHLLWPQELLRECHRILTLNGRILVSVPNIVSLTYRIAWLLGHIPSCAASGNLPFELGNTSYTNNKDCLCGGHVVDFNLRKIVALLGFAGFKIVKIKGSGIIWHKQILPYWLVPVPLASNIICIAQKNIS